MRKEFYLFVLLVLLGSAMVGCVNKVVTLHADTENQEEVLKIAFSPDGKLLIAAAGSIRMWDVPSWKYFGNLNKEPSYPSMLVFSPDGKLLASDDSEKGNDKVLLWNIVTRKVQEEIDPPGINIHSVVFNPNGTLLAIGGNDILLWDVIAKKIVARFDLGSKPVEEVKSIAFSPDGKILACGTLAGYGDNLYLWNAASSRFIGSWKADLGAVDSVAFSPDGAIFATTGHEGVVRLWDAKTHELIAELKGFSRWGNGLSFSPDGKLLACGGMNYGLFGGDKVRIWDIASRRCIAVLKGHTDLILTTAFSPDGKYLASGGGDGTIRIWKLK